MRVCCSARWSTLVAEPGCKDCALECDDAAVFVASQACVVPPEAFDPPPKVDSAVVYLQLRRDRDEVADDEWFIQLVVLAFSQRRRCCAGTKIYVHKEIGKVLLTRPCVPKTLRWMRTFVWPIVAQCATVCGQSGLGNCRRRDSNLRPTDYESVALPS